MLTLNKKIYMIFILIIIVIPLTYAFSEDTRVTTAAYESIYPDIVVDNNGYVLWTDARDGAYQVYYTKLGGYGDKLIYDLILTNSENDAGFASGALDDDKNIHITWSDSRDGIY